MDGLLNALVAAHPSEDVSIVRSELIKSKGYLLRFETSFGLSWAEHIAFVRFTGQDGGVELKWEHPL